MDIIASRQAPLVEELNRILEENNLLLDKLSKLQDYFETTDIDDLVPLLHKLQTKASIIKEQMATNDRIIERIQENLQSIVKEYSFNLSTVGSIN